MGKSRKKRSNSRLIEDRSAIVKNQKKKEQKLGHLIEINKEVTKIYKKKDANSKATNRRVNIKKNKKRISFIKQLKTVFDKNQNKFLGLSKED